MNKRIAIGAVVALLASLAFATVASASDGFEDGDYTIFLPDGAQANFTITDGGFVSDNPFSDDHAKDEIRIASGDVAIEIDADDAKIEISGLTPAEAALVTVAFNGSIFSQENLPDDWKIAFDGDTLSGDDDSTDDDTLSEDDDSVDGDDSDSEDDDSDDTQTTTATTDDSDSEDDDSDDTQTTTATTDDSDSEDDDSTDDDTLSEDDDSVDGDDSDSDDTQTTTATTDDSDSEDDDSSDDDSEDDDSDD